jgi:hypothetical protein
MIKAEITQVSIGKFVALEGLMNENGDFGVAVPQTASLFQIDSNQASRNLKALLGTGFQFDKWKTPLNPKAVNVIPLEQFQELVRALDKKGNVAASRFVDAMLGLSLHQLFCDAFGLKFEKDDRQRWVSSRLTIKVDFKELTDHLKANGFRDSSEYARFIWGVQTKVGVESGTRDTLDLVTLDNLRSAQVRLITMMECGVKPWDALRRL